MSADEIHQLRLQIAERESELKELRKRLAHAQAKHSDVPPSPFHQRQDAAGAEAFDTATPEWRWPLSANEYKRYGRQMILAEVSLQGMPVINDISWKT